MSQQRNAEPTAINRSLTATLQKPAPVHPQRTRNQRHRSIRLLRLHRHRSRDPLGDPQPPPPDEQTTAIEPLTATCQQSYCRTYCEQPKSLTDDSTKASPPPTTNTKPTTDPSDITPTSPPSIPHPQQARVPTIISANNRSPHCDATLQQPVATHNGRETNATDASSEHSAIDPHPQQARANHHIRQQRTISRSLRQNTARPPLQQTPNQ
jgi:hypothetical protein